MKAITLHQPFASLIANGTKTIETRSWAPPKALIGQRIAIHAGEESEPRKTFVIRRSITFPSRPSESERTFDADASGN